ncbi:nwd1 protein [Fusarium globosum]|uniref:Nwd1 protein n=1 Tax=Fusarium globosum TaxID=78864 RepID=A0A8H6DAL5_9HYPO|nr:nwd1 protein [Fusarium globosum]
MEHADDLTDAWKENRGDPEAPEIVRLLDLLETAVLELYISVLDHFTKDTEYDSVLVSFLTVSVRADGTWEGYEGFTLEGHGSSVTSVVFSADGQRLASGSDGKTVKIWDAATGACVQTANVGRILYRLSFELTTNSRLSTDIGLLNLELPNLTPAVDAQSNEEAVLQRASLSGYGISFDGVWVVKDGKNMLWLPPDYRPLESAVVGSTVTIDCRSGRVLVVKLS